MTRRVRWDEVLPASGVGLVSLVAYAFTLAPGLTWAHDSADAGVLAAAAYTLGIAHPPGHPTYVLFAYPFAHLGLPTVAQGTNLFSAVCAAASAALICASVHLAGASRVCRLSPSDRFALSLSAASAGLLFAFSPLAWSFATVTEVHALNALFSTLLLVLAVRSAVQGSIPRGRALAWAVVTGILLGLALGNHPTALLAAGPLAVVAVVVLARAAHSWTAGPAAAAGLGLGLCVYLLLPLRAAASGPINWGDPRTPERFWYMVTGGPYRAYLFGLPAGYVPARVAGLANVMMRQLTPVGLLLAIAGAAAVYREHKWATAAMGVAVVLLSAFAIGYDTSDSYQYLLPVLPFLAHWAGQGLYRASLGLASIRGSVARAARVVPGAALAGVLLLGLARYPTQNLRTDRSGLAFAEATLGQSPPRAVLFTASDGLTFTLWYYQVAEGWRSDVAVVDAGLLREAWYNEAVTHQLGLSPEALEVLASAEPPPDELIGRPVCWVTRDGVSQRFGLNCVE